MKGGERLLGATSAKKGALHGWSSQAGSSVVASARYPKALRDVVVDVGDGEHVLVGTGRNASIVEIATGKPVSDLDGFRKGVSKGASVPGTLVVLDDYSRVYR